MTEGRAAAEPAVRVMVVDDHPMWRDSVSRDLSEAGFGVVAAYPAAKVLILSASGEHRDVLGAVKAGAAGYILKSASRIEFLEAVRRTGAGDAVFSPGLAGLVLGEFRRMASDPAPDSPRLTEREAEILRMVGTGMSYRQIAERLVLSHRTVQNHVQNTLNKLQLHNRVDLVRYAIEHGLDTGQA